MRDENIDLREFLAPINHEKQRVALLTTHGNYYIETLLDEWPDAILIKTEDTEREWLIVKRFIEGIRIEARGTLRRKVEA